MIRQHQHHDHHTNLQHEPHPQKSKPHIYEIPTNDHIILNIVLNDYLINLMTSQSSSSGHIAPVME